MMISSEKANMRAAKAVDFARRHSWAKYPCLGAVSVIYSSEYIRIKLSETADRIKESMKASFRPFGGRVVSVLLSGVFAFMIMPFSAITAYADEVEEPESPAQSEAVELPKPWTKLPPRDGTASTPEDIAKKITLAGIAENSGDYGIKFNIKTLKKDVTADFTESPVYLDKVVRAFRNYGISTDELNIQPVDVSVYTTEDRYALQLSDGYSADITLPIPQDMMNHTDDLKIVRLERDGSMTILDGSITGSSISFNTEHFSVFALVSYRDRLPETDENIGSGAGAVSTGVADTAVSVGSNVFEEDRRRFTKDRKRKIYRIKRIAKDRDLLLL